MSDEHTYRVIVRGRFAAVDDDARARLLAAAGDHDLMTNGFSGTGTLTYDKAIDFFSFRVQLRAKVEATDRTVCDRAMRLATAAVEDLGVDFRDMKASATDLDAMKIRRRR